MWTHPSLSLHVCWVWGKVRNKASFGWWKSGIKVDFFFYIMRSITLNILKFMLVGYIADKSVDCWVLLVPSSTSLYQSATQVSQTSQFQDFFRTIHDFPSIFSWLFPNFHLPPSHPWLIWELPQWMFNVCPNQNACHVIMVGGWPGYCNNLRNYMY